MNRSQEIAKNEFGHTSLSLISLIKDYRRSTWLQYPDICAFIYLHSEFPDRHQPLHVDNQENERPQEGILYFLVTNVLSAKLPVDGLGLLPEFYEIEFQTLCGNTVKYEIIEGKRYNHTWMKCYSWKDGSQSVMLVEYRPIKKTIPRPIGSPDLRRLVGDPLKTTLLKPRIHPLDACQNLALPFRSLQQFAATNTSGDASVSAVRWIDELAGHEISGTLKRTEKRLRTDSRMDMPESFGPPPDPSYFSTVDILPLGCMPSSSQSTGAPPEELVHLLLQMCEDLATLKNIPMEVASVRKFIEDKLEEVDRRIQKLSGSQLHALPAQDLFSSLVKDAYEDVARLKDLPLHVSEIKKLAERGFEKLEKQLEDLKTEGHT